MYQLALRSSQRDLMEPKLGGETLTSTTSSDNSQPELMIHNDDHDQGGRDSPNNHNRGMSPQHDDPDSSSLKIEEDSKLGPLSCAELTSSAATGTGTPTKTKGKGQPHDRKKNKKKKKKKNKHQPRALDPDGDLLVAPSTHVSNIQEDESWTDSDDDDDEDHNDYDSFSNPDETETTTITASPTKDIITDERPSGRNNNNNNNNTITTTYVADESFQIRYYTGGATVSSDEKEQLSSAPTESSEIDESSSCAPPEFDTADIASVVTNAAVVAPVHNNNKTTPGSTMTSTTSITPRWSSGEDGDAASTPKFIGSPLVQPIRKKSNMNDARQSLKKFNAGNRNAMERTQSAESIPQRPVRKVSNVHDMKAKVVQLTRANLEMQREHSSESIPQQPIRKKSNFRQSSNDSIVKQAAIVGHRSAEIELSESSEPLPQQPIRKKSASTSNVKEVMQQATTRRNAEMVQRAQSSESLPSQPIRKASNTTAQKVVHLIPRPAAAKDSGVPAQPIRKISNTSQKVEQLISRRASEHTADKGLPAQPMRKRSSDDDMAEKVGLAMLQSLLKKEIGPHCQVGSYTDAHEQYAKAISNLRADTHSQSLDKLHGVEKLTPQLFKQHAKDAASAKKRYDELKHVWKKYDAVALEKTVDADASEELNDTEDDIEVDWCIFALKIHKIYHELTVSSGDVDLSGPSTDVWLREARKQKAAAARQQNLSPGSPKGRHKDHSPPPTLREESSSKKGKKSPKDGRKIKQVRSSHKGPGSAKKDDKEGSHKNKAKRRGSNHL